MSDDEDSEESSYIREKVEELSGDFCQYMCREFSNDDEIKEAIDCWIQKNFAVLTVEEEPEESISALAFVLASALREYKELKLEPLILRRCLADSLGTMVMDVDGFEHGLDLDNYKLYLPPDVAQDLLHPNLRLCFDRRSSVLSALLSKPLAYGTLALRSVIAVGLTDLRLSPAERLLPLTKSKIKEYSTAIVAMLLRDGRLSLADDRYRPELPKWMNLLSPRRTITTFQEYAQLQIEKLSNNMLGGLGLLDVCLLDRGTFLNHSCAPNAVRAMDPSLYEAKFYTICDIPAGYQLLISYTVFPVDCKPARQRLLNAEHHDFQCQCHCCRYDQPPSLAYAALDALILTRIHTANGVRNAELASLHCWWCGVALPDQSLCGGCRRASYCSVQCQRANLSTHKALCAYLRSQRFRVKIWV